MTPLPARDRINRQNASRSTGPKTPEGKRKASLNALRHGLTGQTVVLPEDDLAAYQKHCAQFRSELKPKGLIETKAVQTIADTYWRLDRIRAMENNVFALAVSGESRQLSADPQIQSALAQASSLDHHADLLAKLSLYEQRLTRTLEKTKSELKQLQQERAAARQKALTSAAQVHNLKEALDEEWTPEESGFEFSSDDLAAWMDRRDLAEQARRFEIYGELPELDSADDAEPPESTATEAA